MYVHYEIYFMKMEIYSKFGHYYPHNEASDTLHMQIKYKQSVWACAVNHLIYF